MSKKAGSRNKRVQHSAAQRIGRYLTVERVIIGGSILGSLVIVAVIALNSWLNRPIDIEGVERIPVTSTAHQEVVNYQHTPPVGGPHAPTWQNCGAYDQPIRDEHAVHSLEHGAVWITYQPDLPAAEVEQLRRITRQGSHRLLSPFPDLPAAIVVSAWGTSCS
jgi:hypothetical protein